jgi:hypothetical protein
MAVVVRMLAFVAVVVAVTRAIGMDVFVLMMGVLAVDFHFTAAAATGRTHCPLLLTLTAARATR